jgi:hypothetical protein
MAIAIVGIEMKALKTAIAFIRSRMEAFSPKPLMAPGVSGPGPWRDWILPCALFLQGVLTMSPLLPLTGFRGMHIYALVYAVSLFALLHERRKLPLCGVLLGLGLWIGSCFTAWYWHDFKIALLPYFFIGSILIAGVSSRDDTHRFINLCTLFLLIMVLLSWIGFLHVVHGGKPLFSILNPDGGENRFFLTTFSNYRVHNSIRPSGVFDEPGTLSFLLCALAALRRIYGRGERTSLALLVAGLVTFSLTHIAFLILFVFLRCDRDFRHNLKVFLLICGGVALVYAFLLREALDDAILWRFKYQPQTHTISGDNRSGQVPLAQSNLSWRSFLWGLDPIGITKVHAFTEKYGQMTTNPMGPLLTSGIFISFPYYFFLIWVAARAIRRREDLVYLAVGLLFIPRPYVTSYGYAVWAMLFLFAPSQAKGVDAPDGAAPS